MADGMILSVEEASITLPSNSAVSYNLTKGQNTANCVPFATMYASVGTANGGDLYPDIYFESGPKVTAQRSATAGTLYLKIYVVEFNPSAVKVQQGTFAFDSSNYSTSAPKAPALQVNRSAALAYYKMVAGENRWISSEIMVYSVDDATINFYHNTLWALSGHWYVFEALNDEFTVQSYGTGDFSPSWPEDITITEVDMSRTMLLANYRTQCGQDSARDAVVAHMQNSTTVRYNSYDQTENVDLRGFVVEFAPNSGVVVTRSSVYFPGGIEDHDISWDITPVDDTRAIVRGAQELTRLYGIGTSGSVRDKSYANLELTNNGTGMRVRNAGSSIGGDWGRVYYELIEFPGPKIGVDFQGVSLSNVIIKQEE